MSSTTTRSRSRKAAALALALVGAAGLSLASASQLNLQGDAATAVQAGTANVTAAACQTTEIKVSYGLTEGAAGDLRTGTSFGFVNAADAITLSSFDAACANKTFRVALGDKANAQLGKVYEAKVPAAGGPVTLAVTGQGAPFGTVDLNAVAQVSVTVF